MAEEEKAQMHEQSGRAHETSRRVLALQIGRRDRLHKDQKVRLNLQN